MKPKFYLSIVGICLFSQSIWANPEETTNILSETAVTANEDDGDINPKRMEFQTNPNVVKINLTSLAFKNVSLQYERILTRKMSVALGFRFMPSTSIPLVSNISSFTGDVSNDMQHFFDETKINGFAITPEFRWYFGKTAGKGGYIAPFVRYETFGLNTNHSVTIEDTKYDIKFDGSHSSFGIGLMLGSQFRLSKNFVLDWWIAGPYVHKSNTSIKASNFTINDADFDEFKREMEEFSFNDNSPINLNTEVNVTKNSVDIKGSFNGVWIRSFGLCLGYKF